MFWNSSKSGYASVSSTFPGTRRLAVSVKLFLAKLEQINCYQVCCVWSVCLIGIIRQGTNKSTVRFIKFKWFSLSRIRLTDVWIMCIITVHCCVYHTLCTTDTQLCITVMHRQHSVCYPLVSHSQQAFRRHFRNRGFAFFATGELDLETARLVSAHCSEPCMTRNSLKN